MDNASKALIMAGAILIAVALVGVGVYLYSSAASQVDNASSQLSAAEIQLKNSEFEQYEGTSVKGSEVKQLIRKVNAFNTQKVFPADITISGDVAAVSDVGDSKYYNVECNYAATGSRYITSISITE